MGWSTLPYPTISHLSQLARTKCRLDFKACFARALVSAVPRSQDTGSSPCQFAARLPCVCFGHCRSLESAYAAYKNPSTTLCVIQRLPPTIIMSAIPGTLAEYDMILSISEAAIDAQLAVLFNTPNPTNFDVNLIPNVMKLGYISYNQKTGKYQPSKVGVTANIQCPTVEITDLGDGATKWRSIRLVIHMDSGSLTYWDVSGSDPELDHLDVSGWTVSWVAQLGSRDIQNIEEEAMHPGAKKAIDNVFKEVPHEDYLVSSLFCLFESTRVANSFSLKDQNGNQVKSDSVAGAFLNSLIITYKNLDPTQYPYVLGYGISQKIPRPVTGTPLFCPSKFYFSTTPYTGDGSQATLNFCMVNGNDHSSNDPLVDPEQNPSAGVFSEPFVYTTRAVNLKSDGTFAVSDILFYTHWLKPTILDPFVNVGKKLSNNAKSTNYEVKYSSGRGTADSSTYQSWSSDWIESGNWFTGKHEHKFSGNSSVTIDWSSVLQSRPQGDIPVSQKRDLNVNVKGTIYNRMDLRQPTLFGHLDEGYVDATTDWDFSLLIQSANDGKWSVTRTTWNVPGTTTQGKHLTVWAYLEAALALFSGDVLNLLTVLLAGMGSLPDDTFDGIGSQLQSISTALIMPAGDVYTFLGLDCDGEGNLYSHIKYKTIIS
ncbi:hypothetical protein EW146_g8116 [Bondarzewia mesenterica]|uniref:Uncharacterized protein n=1 Tax=Bondarzewia mesenterica TaxID=1095465 RepID=A0A4S4LIR5_9AGAM|nr:hypothetical protein EW146_g8116 [Bondarzewia mesenterica]